MIYFRPCEHLPGSSGLSACPYSEPGAAGSALPAVPCAHCSACKGSAAPAAPSYAKQAINREKQE